MKVVEEYDRAGGGGWWRRRMMVEEEEDGGGGFGCHGGKFCINVQTARD